MFDKLGPRKNNYRFIDFCGHNLNAVPQVKLNYYLLFRLSVFKQKSHKGTFAPKNVT